MLDNIMTTVRVPIDDIIAGEGDRKSYCQSHDTNMSSTSESMMLGSAIKGLSQAGMYPFKTVSHYSQSPQEMADKVLSIKIDRYLAPKAVPHLDAHILCTMGHKDRIEAILTQPACLSFDTLLEMKTRAAICGMNNTIFDQHLDQPRAEMFVGEALRPFKRVVELITPEIVVIPATIEDEDEVGKPDPDAVPAWNFKGEDDIVAKYCEE